MHFYRGEEVVKKKSSSIWITLKILSLVRMIHSRAEENSSERKRADLRLNGRIYWRNRTPPILYPGAPNPRDGQEHCKMLILCLVWTWSILGRDPKYGNCMVNLNVLQRTGLGRNVGVDIARAVFGIREVEWKCFLGMTSKGYTCRF